MFLPGMVFEPVAVWFVSLARRAAAKVKNDVWRSRLAAWAEKPFWCGVCSSGWAAFWLDVFLGDLGAATIFRMFAAMGASFWLANVFLRDK
ncbi:MAG: hypothetical protein NZ534_11620 [Bacteroidia bacterium]|nr:hypothetical protein [Bacteroidia bacterium]